MIDNKKKTCEDQDNKPLYKDSDNDKERDNYSDNDKQKDKDNDNDNSLINILIDFIKDELLKSNIRYEIVKPILIYIL